MKAIINGKIVLKNAIISHGCVVFDWGILAVGSMETISIPKEAELFDAEGAYVGPGFIDTHCHAANQYNSFEYPKEYAAFHLRYGATGLLATLGYDLPYPILFEGIENIKKAIKNGVNNIVGIHLEGPYTNPNYGYPSEVQLKPDPYMLGKLFEAGDGLVKLMTFAPEMEGAQEIAKVAQKYGVVLSVGHSEASEEQILSNLKYGLRVACHHRNATGYSVKPCMGIRGIGVDEVVCACDDIYAEVIPDYEGYHVRPNMLRFVVKAKGDDKVMIITDSSSASGQPYAPEKNILGECDINLMPGNLLSGSRLNMSKACFNMKQHTGSSMVSLFKMASTNASKALGLSNIGSIELGKDADILICNSDFDIQKVFLKGETVFSLDSSSSGNVAAE